MGHISELQENPCQDHTFFTLGPFLLIPLIVPVGKGCEMTLNQVFRSMAHAIPAVFDIIVLDHKIKPFLFGL